MPSKTVLLIILAIVILGLAVSFVYFKGVSGPSNIEPQSESINPGSLAWQEVTSSAAFGPRDSMGFVVFKDKIWLMGGLDGTTRMIEPGNVIYGSAPHFSDVWSTENGKDWQLVLKNAPWGKRRSAQVVSFKGKMWLMGGWGPEIGTKNDVWSSEDGTDWKLEARAAEWPAREGHSVLVFQNRLFLIGGVRYDKHQVFNDVWVSDDAVRWTELTENAGWQPRWDFASAAFNNKLWLIGGMNLDQEMFNDVWSSEDGSSWALETSSPPFSTRQGFITEYKNYLWLMGRLNDVTNRGVNDVWYSLDGISWQKTKKDPEWTGREDFGAVVFKDKIWIFAGMDKNWQWKNDIWASTAELVNK